MIPIKVDIKKAEKYYKDFIEGILISKTKKKTIKEHLKELAEKIKELPEKEIIEKSKLFEILADEKKYKELFIAEPNMLKIFAKEYYEIIYQKVEKYNEIKKFCGNLISKYKKEHNNIRNEEIKVKREECEKRYNILCYDSYNQINKKIFSLFVAKGYGEKLDKYSFVDFTGVRVCPYCNRAFVYEPMTDKEWKEYKKLSKDIKKEATGKWKIKGQIDHFFPKSKYPILALSYFNLIPSCGVCNYVKSEQDPLEISELKSPYEIKADEFEFTPGIKNTKIFSYRLNEIAEGLTVKLKAPQGNKTVFVLEDIYYNHRDIAAEVILKAKIYNKEYVRYIKELFSIEYPETAEDKDKKHKRRVIFPIKGADIHRLVFWAYKDTPGKRPLSKFISDIAKQIINKF